MISFVVRGDPATQGNKTPHAVRRKNARGDWEYTGQIAVVEGKTKASQLKFTTWRDDVKTAAMKAMRDPSLFPLEGPLRASMVFTLRRPKNHWRTGRNAHLLKDAAPAYPDVKPDLSKLVRAVEDAMKHAGVYRDDAQLVSYGALMVYVGDPAGQPFPGVWVTVHPMGEESPVRSLPSDAAAM